MVAFRPAWMAGRQMLPAARQSVAHPRGALVGATLALLSWMAWSVGETLGEQRDLIRELREEIREPGAMLDDPDEAESVPEREEVFRTVPQILDRLDEIEGRLDDIDAGGAG